MLKNWLYFLQEADGRSITRDNGVVSSTAKPTPIPETPEGWQEVSIGWERNMQRLGAMRNFTVAMGFVGAAAQILRTIAYTQNLERAIFLLITRLYLLLTATTYQYRYKKFYKGQLDLSTFRDGETKVTVNIAEGEAAKRLKANEATTYTLPIDQDPEHVAVLMDGLELQQRATMLPTNGYLNGQTVENAGQHLVHLDLVQQETRSPLGIKSVARRRFSDNANLSNSTDYFFQTSNAETSLTIRYKFKINVALATAISPNPLASSKVFIRYFNQAGVATGVELTHFGTGGQLYKDHVVEGTFTHVFPPNSRLYLITVLMIGGGIATGPAADESVFWNYDPEDSLFELSYNYRPPATYVKGLPVDVVLRRLGVRIFGADGLTSSALLQRMRGMVLISGDSLRGFQDASIKTSLSQFYEACRVVMAAGMGMHDGKLIIEAADFFFPDTEPIPLGEVKDHDLTPAADLMASTVRIGYNDPQVEDINGRFAFNTSQLRTTPITTVSREHTLVCPYIADPYKIEITRINLEGRTTTDGAADNSVFILHTDADDVQTDPDTGLQYRKLYRLDYDTLEGVSGPSVFNVEGLSPARLLEVHRRYLSAINHPFAGLPLKLQSADRNTALRTEWQSPIASIPTVFDEDADYTIGGSPLFLPWYADFETEVPADLVDMLEQDSYRPFSWVWRGITLTGFLIKAAIEPEKASGQSYRMLLSAKNDLSKLI